MRTRGGQPTWGKRTSRARDLFAGAGGTPGATLPPLRARYSPRPLPPHPTAEDWERLEEDFARSTRHHGSYFEPAPLHASIRKTVLERGWSLLVHDPRGAWYDPYRRAMEPTRWHIDQPVLRHVDFAQRVPPHSLFQEIATWVGTVVTGPDTAADTIDDAMRAGDHGTDHTSYRPRTKQHRNRR